MKRVVPTLGFESSCIFTAAAAAGLRGATMHQNLPVWRLLRPGPFILLGGRRAPRVRLEGLLGEMLRAYPPSLRAPVAWLGSGCGGHVHASVALGGPLLPVHTMVMQMRHGDPDDPAGYLEACRPAARAILERHPWAHLVVHLDPIHDRPMVRHFLILRFKFHALPPVYKEFLRDHVEPGGTLVFSRVSYPWTWHRAEDRFHLQIGGYGDITAGEFQGGSERIDRWFGARGESKRGGWPLDLPRETREESEWGTPAALEEPARAAAGELGLNFLSLEFSHPSQPGLMAAHLWAARLQREGRGARGYAVDSFWTHQPIAASRGRRIPYWAPWSDTHSLETARGHMDRLKEFGGPPDVLLGRSPGMGPDIAGITPWTRMLRDHFQRVASGGHATDDNTRMGLLSALHGTAQYEKMVRRDARGTGEPPRGRLGVDDIREAARWAGAKVKEG